MPESIVSNMSCFSLIELFMGLYPPINNKLALIVR